MTTNGIPETPMTSPNIEALTQLVPHLPSTIHGHDVREYDCEGGECIGIALENEERGAVQRAMMTKGAVLMMHGHEVATEFVMPKTGALRVEMPDRTVEVRPGDVVRIPPGTPHTVTALERTWMYAVTIPADREVYPDAG